jgi:hypothetical protein
MVTMIQANMQVISQIGKQLSRARHQRPAGDGRVSSWALGGLVRDETPASHRGQEGLDLRPSPEKGYLSYQAIDNIRTCTTLIQLLR